jgi:hypothetical protein
VSEKKIKRSNVIELWGDDYPDVKRWLGRLQSKKTNAWYLWQFCKWAKRTPTELLALKTKLADTRAEQLLDDFAIAETPQFTNPIKFNIIIAVKSFFKHNYRDLAKASGKFTLKQQREHKKPRKEDLRRLWDYALNLRDKALITFVNSTALAKETLSELKWKHFEEDWEQKELPCINCPSEILKGHGVGRYKGVRQITFLTPEAKADLVRYKEWLERKIGRKFEPEDNVWRNVRAPYEPLDYNRLGNLIVELSKNAGVRFSLHDGRRWVETALEEIGIHPNWARKIRGRKVRGEESPYSQPEVDKLRAKYSEAVPLLQFTVEATKSNDNALQSKKENLILLAKNVFAMKDEEIKKVFRSVRAPRTLEAEIKALEEKIAKEQKKQQTTTNNDCTDGKHCQRIVSEADLSGLLTEGWRVAAVLPSGKIVVSNE